ncbi:MAG TPA: hypothetical protein VM409_00775 [Chloroflexia bacterium]|nr:hypothetical protein [Chloroflexia bacterium]
MVGTRPRPPVVDAQVNGGPISVVGEAATRNQVRTVPARSRMERIGFWVVVAAGFALLILLMGVLLPPIFGGIATGVYMGLFVAALTAMNMRRPSGWANKLMGRRVFPVLRASETELIKLALVNGAMTGVFAFFFHVVAAVLGPFFGGLLVFGGLVGACVFYNRARTVIKP